MPYEVFKSVKSGEFYWRFKSLGNNKTIGRSTDGYKNKADCIHSIELIKASKDAAILDLTKRKKK